ncbi:MAG TPA: glucose-1-phosphate adenylyltransferase [Candidatus Sabulitectum sp.]|nr:glucose-1-phosphate adenylyltransferase [Candidatus Sabulitectum sp.]HPR22483.1 glucose-1-phosphate adenylyltransferase [Candidatus Sabulitectum sp.]HRW77608.1 glucose-1-phosphate adenylyltransferase [Candidatus Sabulitectum sp.]
MAVVSVILGGGRGTRLFPLTLHRSKPAVPIGGKYRLIDIPVSNCVNNGIRKILVLTQYNSESLNRHVGQTYRFDRFSDGFVSILAAEQTPENTNWFQGTADAVRQGLVHILSLCPDMVLILSGDQLYRMDFTRFIGEFVASGADISIATKPVTAEEAPGLGIMQVSTGGRITGFHEKPSPESLSGLTSDQQGVTADKPFLGSMGIYLFKPDVLKRILLQEDRDKTDFGKEIIPGAIDRYLVTSYLFDGYWSDIGTIRSFFKANIDMAMPEPEFDLYSKFTPLYTRARALPGARLRNCTLDNAIVCGASDIAGSSIRNSIVGIRSYIGRGTSIESSVLMGADYWKGHPRDEGASSPGTPALGIGENCVISNAILDKNVRIGNDVRLVNERGLDKMDSENIYIRDGIIVIPKGVSVPDGTVV